MRAAHTQETFFYLICSASQGVSWFAHFCARSVIALNKMSWDCQFTRARLFRWYEYEIHIHTYQLDIVTFGVGKNEKKCIELENRVSSVRKVQIKDTVAFHLPNIHELSERSTRCKLVRRGQWYFEWKLNVNIKRENVCYSLQSAHSVDENEIFHAIFLIHGPEVEYSIGQQQHRWSFKLFCIYYQ